MAADDKGGATEDLLEKICTKMFLADFVVRNPKYRKPNKQQKEAADFLVPFGDHLLAFQVRSKVEQKSATQKEAKDFNRIRRRVDAALDQFKAVKEALDENNILELRNGRGILLPFDRASVQLVSGVVVLDLVGEEKFAVDDRTEVLAGYVVRNKVPIHVFMRDVFEELAGELDTVPDFVSYLDVRRTLFERGILCATTSELDFLAFYRSRRV
jgi:hypothetical protein